MRHYFKGKKEKSLTFSSYLPLSKEIPSRMPGLLLCEPTELYNILNQATKLSRLTEPNYLCLFDVRSKWEYDESHVITALRVKKKNNEYLLPESVDLECVKYCVVYDNNTSTLEVLLKDDDDDSDSDSAGKDVVPGAAIEYGRILTRLTRHPVYILKGGYERFSGTYHFLRTQKIIWMPQELDAFQPYPIEIMPGEVFLGNFSQACDPKIQKDLKVKAHVNVSMDTGPFFAGDPDRLLHIQIEDSPEAQILPFLRRTCHFIGLFWITTPHALERKGPAQHMPHLGEISSRTRPTSREPSVKRATVVFTLRAVGPKIVG
nr:serine/threonine/tyrosine-interacting-like protein 1 isoform X4 [Chlorocebus sabaeus]